MHRIAIMTPPPVTNGMLLLWLSSTNGMVHDTISSIYLHGTKLENTGVYYVLLARVIVLASTYKKSREFAIHPRGSDRK